MAAEKRESSRVRDVQQKRVLDEAARRRRARKALEALEQDNFQDDPHADLKMSKKAPRFEESMEVGASATSAAKKKRRSRGEYIKQRLKKNFSALIEEEQMGVREAPNYMSACTPPSPFPERHFCAVCGPIELHVCTVWNAVLQRQMFGDTQGYQMFEVDSLICRVYRVSQNMTFTTAIRQCASLDGDRQMVLVGGHMTS